MDKQVSINPAIKEILSDFNVNVDTGIMCLLAIYHNLTDIPKFERIYELTFKQINITKIVERNYIKKEVIWNIPLYSHEIQENEWVWVLKEYRTLFSSVDKGKAGTPSGCVKRMKDFFSKHPEVRKEDVLAAAKMYVDTLNDKKYMQNADYFIVKDKGSSATSRLEQFLELVKEQRVQQIERKQLR